MMVENVLTILRINSGMKIEKGQNSISKASTRIKHKDA
jgi:hypothetical protein